MVYNVHPSLIFLYINVSSSSASVTVREHLLTSSLTPGYIQVAYSPVCVCPYTPKALLETGSQGQSLAWLMPNILSVTATSFYYYYLFYYYWGGGLLLRALRGPRAALWSSFSPPPFCRFRGLSSGWPACTARLYPWAIALDQDVHTNINVHSLNTACQLHSRVREHWH